MLTDALHFAYLKHPVWVLPSYVCSGLCLAISCVIQIHVIVTWKAVRFPKYLGPCTMQEIQMQLIICQALFVLAQSWPLWPFEAMNQYSQSVIISNVHITPESLHPNHCKTQRVLFVWYYMRCLNFSTSFSFQFLILLLIIFIRFFFYPGIPIFGSLHFPVFSAISHIYLFQVPYCTRDRFKTLVTIFLHLLSYSALNFFYIVFVITSYSYLISISFLFLFACLFYLF